MNLSKNKKNKEKENWTVNEFKNAKLGDMRRTKRLIKIIDDFTKSPECSINHISEDWADTKAAYRFFQNNEIHESNILKAHLTKTRERSSSHKIILSIQDTSYISYKNHKATTGLGIIASRIRSEKSNFRTPGLVMHTAFAITTDGLPLGLLDQKIHSRPPLSEELLERKKRSHGIAVPIEDKESIKWLESLKKSKETMAYTGTQVITVCDREADMYEFFYYAHQLDAPILVRANHDRVINKKPRKYKRPQEIEQKERLWAWINKQPLKGQITQEISAQDKKVARDACLNVRFGTFTMNPNKHCRRHYTQPLPDLEVQAIYVIEQNPPTGTEPLEWLLLTNLPVENLESALEKVRWYALRWRIETFHKILKSGLGVEECRLGRADRLIRYLTVMSIIAWRLFYMTLLARTDSEQPCTIILAEAEWKVLHARMSKTQIYPQGPPSIKEAVIWIAKLGGFLARKNDGYPGPITLWRGWKRLAELVDGWNLAHSHLQ